MNEDTSCYVPPRAIIDIFADKGMSLSNPAIFGGWTNPKMQAKVQAELIQHHYPKMDRETQLRANRTIENLTAQHGSLV